MAPGKPGKSAGGSEDPSVTLFRQYLRIDTVHPKPDYGEEGTGGDWGAMEAARLAARLRPFHQPLVWSLDPPAWFLGPGLS